MSRTRCRSSWSRIASQDWAVQRLIAPIVGLLLVSGGRIARAEEGLVNVHAEVGAGILLNDAAATDVDIAGVGFGLKVDVPVHRWVAPQLGYGLVYLPGSGGAEASVHLVLAGVRVRLLNDERGFLAKMWPRGPKGNAWGNLWVDLGIGYAYAHTVDAGAHWAALEVGVGYEFSLLSPLQIGPYVSYRQVFVKRTYPAFLCLGISISFGYPKVIPKAKPMPRVRPRPRPDIGGRPGDRDGDTVGDGIDKCPSTPPGAQVDENGCEYIRGRMIFPGIRFKQDSTQLVPGAEFDLRRMAELIKAHPELKVEISGHTETAGSFEDNLKLSLKRAQIVRDAVVKLGVPLEQITVKGYGVSAPLVTHGPPEEKRKKNVRIEFRFSAGQPRPEPVRRPGAPAPPPTP